MSEPSQEAAGVRGRFSRWRARSRGRSTLKAAYAQAARDVKRMDPAVRERIGRANLTKADLQQLASFHVNAQFQPGRFGDLSERLGQAANARLQQAGPAPRQPRISRTRNPVRGLVNRYSRWGRNERRGTKALKAALKQAARDVKRTDPAVQLAIGRSTFNSADLAAMASGRMDQVFRPEGRLHGTPGQQAQNGAGRQGPAPQQSDQLTQRIAALQQSILENQQRAITLMEESNRLQAEMRELLEARVQQIQQEVAGINQALGTGQDLNPRQAGTNELEAGGDQQPGEQRAEGEAERGVPEEPRAEGEQSEVGEGETGVGEGEGARAEGEAEVGEQPRAEGDQEVQIGERPAGDQEVQTGERPAGAEAQVGDNGAQVGDGGEPQAEPERNDGERWTRSSETQGQSAREEEARNSQQRGTDPQQPGVNGQPGVNEQPRGVDPRVAAAYARSQGQAAVEKPSAEGDTKFALKLNDAVAPLNKVSTQQTEGAVKAGADDATRRQQRSGQAPTSRKGPSGREGG